MCWRVINFSMDTIYSKQHQTGSRLKSKKPRKKVRTNKDVKIQCYMDLRMYLKIMMSINENLFAYFGIDSIFMECTINAICFKLFR